MFKKAKLNRKVMKSMSSADTDEVPEVRNHKSLPYGAGKEPRLSHGGEVKTKVLVNGNFERIIGNSDSEFGVGNIGDVDEAQVFSKVQAKPVAQKFSKVQTKSINTEKQIHHWDVRISERVKALSQFFR